MSILSFEKKIKKKSISAIAILTCITILVAGCSNTNKKDSNTTSSAMPKTEEQRFDEFLETLPPKYMDNDDMNMNYSFLNPENFGYKDEVLTMPTSTIESNEQSKKDTADLIVKFEDFDREKLTKSQQLSYDVLLDNLKRILPLYDDYYISTNFLGSFLGFQAQLPILLNDFRFSRKSDLDDYFNILKTSDSTFKSYVALEKERQAKGVGMSQTILTKVIEQCDNLVSQPRPYLIETVNEKFDKLDFLSDKEKADAKAKNEQLLTVDFINAYKNLAVELKTIKAPDKDLGLCHTEGGTEYYEKLMRYSTGTDYTIEEMREYLTHHYNQYMFDLQTNLQLNPEALKILQAGKADYGDFKTAEENVDFLKEKVAKDFPPLPHLDYKITPVPKELEENFSPAAYMSPPIDVGEDNIESLYLNGKYNQSLYPIIAHEGYPGHMYQITYARMLQFPAARSLSYYTGYSEGWATYVENNAGQYSDKDTQMLHFFELNAQVTNMLIALYDIGVHVDGWDRDEFYKNYSNDFTASKESSDYLFDLILETPTNYLKYYVGGAKFEDFREKAKEALGDNFSIKKFHETVLSTGEAPFWVVEAAVDEYIAAEKPANSSESESSGGPVAGEPSSTLASELANAA